MGRTSTATATAAATSSSSSLAARPPTSPPPPLPLPPTTSSPPRPLPLPPTITSPPPAAGAARLQPPQAAAMGGCRPYAEVTTARAARSPPPLLLPCTHRDMSTEVQPEFSWREVLTSISQAFALSFSKHIWLIGLLEDNKRSKYRYCS